MAQSALETAGPAQSGYEHNPVSKTNPWRRLVTDVSRNRPIIWAHRLDLAILFFLVASLFAVVAGYILGAWSIALDFGADRLRFSGTDAINFTIWSFIILCFLFCVFWGHRVINSIRLPFAARLNARLEFLMLQIAVLFIFLPPLIFYLTVGLVNGRIIDTRELLSLLTCVSFAYCLGLFVYISRTLSVKAAFLTILVAIGSFFIGLLMYMIMEFNDTHWKAYGIFILMAIGCFGLALAALRPNSLWFLTFFFGMLGITREPRKISFYRPYRPPSRFFRPVAG